jgi:hypothetical protein
MKQHDKCTILLDAVPCKWYKYLMELLILVNFYINIKGDFT